MASPVRLYQKEMHDNLGFFATWFPGDRLSIGDIGTLEQGRLRKWTSLAELGISVKTGERGPSRNVQYTSRSGTTIDVSGGAAISGGGKAEVKVTFSREGAFLFHAVGLQDQTLEDRLILAGAIEEAYAGGRWRKEWVLVEALYTTRAATIIVSEDKSAELRLNVGVPVPLGSVPLADPRLGVSVSSTRGQITQVVGALGERDPDLTPLYTCWRLRDPLFGSPSVVPVRGPADRGSSFVRPSIDDLLES